MENLITYAAIYLVGTTNGIALVTAVLLISKMIERLKNDN